MRLSARFGWHAALVLLLLAGGCSESGDSIQAPDPDPFETDLTDPAAVIQAQSRAWSEQNEVAYEALLDDEFEFYPLTEDADDFPWMGGESWNRTTELDMAGNMFDNNYTQGNGAVDLIEMQTTIENIGTPVNDRVEVFSSAIGRAMWSAVDGAIFDTRLKFVLVLRDQYWRIAEIREIPRAAGRVVGLGEDFSTWGDIKSLYRKQVVVNLTDPEAVVQRHTQAWNEQDFAMLEALLDSPFEFYPLAEDADDFPWMGGDDSWGRTDELGMAENMSMTTSPKGRVRSTSSR